MDKYAIIKLGGKQFMVQEGDTFTVERQSSVKLNVLFFTDGKSVLIGSPDVPGVEVKAEILKDEEKTEKTDVRRFRNKSRHRRAKGHKQPMSVIKIKAISHGKKDTKPSTKKVVKVKKKVLPGAKRKAVAK